MAIKREYGWLCGVCPKAKPNFETGVTLCCGKRLGIVGSKEGKLKHLSVEPPERAADIVLGM